MYLFICYNGKEDTHKNAKEAKMAKYNVAVYSRISREDGDKAESESLVNQRELIKAYVKGQREMSIVDYYSDDNYSGTNFNRPEFTRMYDDIKEGKINCVVVKDLSRFGRDYIDVGNYIQRVFPKYGVRFIAINDGVDSLIKQYDMITPIKNIFNEQYARDISNKIISTFRNKQESGQFMGAFPSYGYTKDPNNKYKLIIDDYPATIVKRIFKMFCDGKGKIGIAKTLNEEKILCPSEYKKSIGMKYQNSNRLYNTSYWTYSTIHKILSNEIYAGNMVQHKSNASKFDYSSKMVAEEDWIIVKNTHEAIIDKHTWDTTQSLLKKRTRQMSFEQNVSIFAGFLCCGDCGRAMAKITWSDRRRYVCGTYKRYPGVGCTSHSINEETLKSIILADINFILSKINNIRETVNKIVSQNQNKNPNDYTTTISNIEVQLSKIKHLKKSIYEDYKMGLLTQEEFTEYKSDYDKQELNMNDLLKKLKNDSQSEEETLLESDFIKSLKSTSQINELDRVILDTFYDKIYIYEDKKIKFKYKFEEIIDIIINY